MMPVMSAPRQELDWLDVQVLVDSIPSLIHTARPDGYLDYFNKRWLDHLGVSLDKVTGWNWTDFIHAEDVEGIVARWRTCLETGEIFEYETRVRMANGEYRWMFHRKWPLRDARGDIVKWYGSSMDVEERKTAEEALRSSEAYLAEAQRISHTGSFGWKASTDEIFWSAETFRIYQCDPTTKPTREFILSRIHRDDLDLVRAQIERASRGGDGFDFEHRIQLPDGSVRYLRVTANVLRDNANNIEFVGAVTDVTERHRAEAVIREREAELRQIVDLAPQFVAVFGPDNESLYANRMLLDYLGITLEEWTAIQECDSELRH
jgi:PAS domain S-box-containing protein